MRRTTTSISIFLKALHSNLKNQYVSNPFGCEHGLTLFFLLPVLPSLHSSLLFLRATPTPQRPVPQPTRRRQVNLALKQKSDIEHYRNKLRLKAKRKGYYDFPSADAGSGALVQRHRSGPESASEEHGRPLEGDDERGSTYVKPHRR